MRLFRLREFALTRKLDVVMVIPVIDTFIGIATKDGKTQWVAKYASHLGNASDVLQDEDIIGDALEAIQQ